MNLTEVPDFVLWPETHYVFVEKIGPFMKTAPEAWQQLHGVVPAIAERNKITGYMSLYKVGLSLYRAGVSLAAPPVELPQGLAYEKLAEGKYCRFTLTGPYSDMPAACGRAFQMVAEQKIPLRDDFNIEHYVNDPKTTPAEQLITELLFPTLR